MSVGDTGKRLAILVHEVRSPVAALGAIAEAYRSDREPEARRRLADLALAACRGIERIVTDATVASVRLETVDVGRVVSDAAAAARLRGAPNVRAVVEPGLPPVAGDGVRIRQALENLVANALTHGSSAGEIVVRARLHEGELCVSVSDLGPGIPLDQQRRIFETGVRLDPDRPGSGLGLAVVHAIADAHGAAVRVESAPGRGATFTLAFPLERTGGAGA
jgi:two-component system, OmpR family, sensor kinase